MNPFHRNQNRIDDICWKIHDLGLMKDAEIHQLAHDWGDIEDTMYYHKAALDRLRKALKTYESNHTKCIDILGSICGWYFEFQGHMESSEKLIEKLMKAIRKHRNCLTRATIGEHVTRSHSGGQRPGGRQPRPRRRLQRRRDGR
jgi:hypothetical protein